MEKVFDYTGVAIAHFYHDGKGDFIMLKRGKNAQAGQQY